MRGVRDQSGVILVLIDLYSNQKQFIVVITYISVLSLVLYVFGLINTYCVLVVINFCVNSIKCSFVCCAKVVKMFRVTGRNVLRKKEKFFLNSVKKYATESNIPSNADVVIIGKIFLLFLVIKTSNS